MAGGEGPPTTTPNRTENPKPRHGRQSRTLGVPPIPIPKFLQIHTLHLNRDDSGRAKRLPFGGAVRTRISSQCLKWHWRGKTSRADEGMKYEDREFALHTIKEATRAERTPALRTSATRN